MGPGPDPGEPGGTGTRGHGDRISRSCAEAPGGSGGEELRSQSPGGPAGFGTRLTSPAPAFPSPRCRLPGLPRVCRGKRSPGDTRGLHCRVGGDSGQRTCNPWGPIALLIEVFFFLIFSMKEEGAGAGVGELGCPHKWGWAEPRVTPARTRELQSTPGAGLSLADSFHQTPQHPQSSGETLPHGPGARLDPGSCRDQNTGMRVSCEPPTLVGPGAVSPEPPQIPAGQNPKTLQGLAGSLLSSGLSQGRTRRDHGEQGMPFHRETTQD